MTASALPAFPVPHVLAAHIESARRRWLSAPAVEVVTIASDAELVNGHLAGDPQAFSELVKRYTRAIYNVTYRFTNDAHEAENLTQETFVRAWSALPRLTLDKPLKAYFVKIAVNLCRDWAEQKKIENVVPLEPEGETDIADELGDPLHAVGEQELVERIRAKMELLPPLYRTVLAMRYTEEMSYEEMTIALDLPLNTVRTHLHRAKARLRELLEQD
jgi:RNA polymerase sigma-70 factor (ECF subfamily)